MNDWGDETREAQERIRELEEDNAFLRGQAEEPVRQVGWDDVGPVQTVLLMRIYDVLLAILRETNPTLASNIDDVHKAGYIFGPPPSFRPGNPESGTGYHVTNE